MTVVRFADRTGGLAPPIHFALVHYGDDELRVGMLAFLRPALEDPNEAIYLCGPAGDASRLLAYLGASVGRDLAPDVAARRIVLGQGDPDADQQLQNLLDPVHELCKGFSLVRVVGRAAWGDVGYAVPEDFLWYESRILPLIAGLPVAVMCLYDAARLPARALVYGALETHTHTWIDGQLTESPSFIPADVYLKERLIHLPWLEHGRGH